MDGDETYAGSHSYDRFRDAVTSITALKHVIPTHQGRAAERLLFTAVMQAYGERAEGTEQPTVIANTFFDTTRAK